MIPDVTLPGSVQALILVIGFFMPGFIAGKVFELCFPRGEMPERIRLLEYLTLSFVNYALWSFVIVVVVRGELWQTRPFTFAGILFAVVLVSPLVLGFAMAAATEKRSFQHLAARFGIRAPHHIATAWEWFFREHPTSRWWVVIRLRSGIMVYGFFGWNSYMGNVPGHRDLYLERECKLNREGNLQVIKDGGGIYLRYGDIEAIAFRPVKEEKQDNAQEEQ